MVRVDASWDKAALDARQLAETTSRVLGRECVVDGVDPSPFPYRSGSPATAGLWRVDVRVRGGESVAYFVKLLRHVRLWPDLLHIPVEQRDEFASWFPWRYEYELVASGIGALLPAGMRTPALHARREADADHLALWFEFVDQRAAAWADVDFVRAARLLGALAARRREGAAANASLPDQARVSPPGIRRYVGGRVANTFVPLIRGDELWRHPTVAAAMSVSGDGRIVDDLRALADRLPAILDVLDELPRTYAHGDASPQNLLIPASAPDEFVVVDWGMGNLQPVGFDLGQLLVGLAHAGELDPSELPRIHAAILPSYLDGLAGEGFDVAEADVVAGYLGSLVARCALSSLPLELLGGPPTPPNVALFAQRLRLTRALVDLSAETFAAVRHA
jgi:hypothetical protein